MTVRVVFDGPSVPFVRRFGRVLAVSGGAVLLVVAVVAVAGVLLIGPLLFLGDQGWSEEERPQAAVVAVVCLLVALVCFPLALRLLRGRRRLVLFLRRFGFADATESVSFAASQVVGRSWRLVTLDDDQIAPVGGSTGPRRLLGIFGMVFVVLVCAALWWFAAGGPDRLFDSVYEGTTGSTEELGIAEAIAAEFGRALAAGIIAALLLMLIIAGTVLVGVSSLFTVFSFGRSLGTERAKTARIRSRRDVAVKTNRIERRSARIFAPRLVVVRVADEVWREAVQAFAAKSDAVVVDVSEVSENLLWEIRTLLPLLGSRCLIVGRADLLTRTVDGRTILDSELGHELDGRTVLAYRTGRRDVHRFARGVEGFLEACA